MFENALLAYVNIKDNTFDNADFNFDNEFNFHLNIDKSNNPYKYKLAAERKTSTPIPSGFWGKNIKALNVIVGKNGSGKTSFFRFMCNNLFTSAAMNGEGMLYIVKCNNVFYYFTNIPKNFLSFDESITKLKINLQDGKYYIFNERNKSSIYFENNYIWKNAIMYSNSFDLEYFPAEAEFFIDVSKNKNVNCAYEKITQGNQEKISLSKAILGQSYEKIIKYFSEPDFNSLSKKLNVKLPTAIIFFLKDKINNKYSEIINQKKYSQKFPNSKFIGKNRYEIYQRDDSQFEFEAAINKFSFILMHTLLDKEKISADVFDKFVDLLSTTYNSNGIEIAHRLLAANNIIDYTDILKFLNNKSKQYILYWQSDDKFVFKWNEDDMSLIKKLLSSKSDCEFFNTDLARIDGNGYYSAGEYSKLNLFLSLYDARTNVMKNESVVNNNILLLMDEYDVCMHPEFQIKIISEIIEMIECIFEDYSVQIILSTNTPLELTDIPPQSIIYLENRKSTSLPSNSQTFAGNVCSLLKDSFYINSTMGDFAKKKINSVLDLIHGKQTSMTHDEAKFIISIIGEPVIKRKLEEMYNCRFSSKKEKVIDKLLVLKNSIESNYDKEPFAYERILSMIDEMYKLLNEMEDE